MIKNVLGATEKMLLHKDVQRHGLTGPQKLFLINRIRQEMFLFYREENVGRSIRDWLERFSSFILCLGGNHSDVSTLC